MTCLFCQHRYLTDDEQDMYMKIAAEVYNNNVLKIMANETYQGYTLEHQAQMLADVRDLLSDDVKDQFLGWLSSTRESTPRTDTKAAKNETKRRQQIVKQILAG